MNHLYGCEEDKLFEWLRGARVRSSLSAQESHEARMETAGEDNDPAAFRRALKGWEQVSVVAIGEARAGRVAT